MRKSLWFSLLALSTQVQASDLVSVYHDALQGSPILQTDLSTNQATHENIPIAISALLPQVTVSANLSYTGVNETGFNTNYPSDGYSLMVTQPLFNYTAFSAMFNVTNSTHAADETYLAQQQNFILTVAQDYFAVLQAEDNVAFAEAQLKSLDATLVQTEQKFEVGVGTYTDVAQARANDQSAKATLVQNQNTLADDNETLRELTGKLETNLAVVKADFPYVLPVPDDLNTWVKNALITNPSLLSEQYTTKAALATVNQNIGNQLPTVSLVLSLSQTFYRENVSPVIASPPYESDASIALALNWTLFSGGELMASSLQAANQYVSSEDTTVNLTRQTQSNVTNDFLSVVSGRSQVIANKQAVVSAKITLDDYNAKYKVGTATIVDVLNATQTLYQDQSNLAAAEYQYINSSLQLKYDAGTLNAKDLTDLNQYLQVTE